MAAPRVFISSTCFDLAEIRDGLVAFLENFGLDVALSERGDIFYHPDLHTHQSCVAETSACQLFILIIGGRFGGKYISDRSKSITNAEYSAARESGIPVFTFVKQDVLNDHNLWQRNKGKSFASEIEYPSIEKYDHASDIFDFIDHVRQSGVNNGFFGFRYAKDVHGFLRKQLSGMLFDHLQKRSLSRQLAGNAEIIGNLSIASSKIEELVKSIYRSVEAADAGKRIHDLDQEGEAEELFSFVARKTGDSEFISGTEIDDLASSSSDLFWQFLNRGAYFDISVDFDGSPDALVYEILDIVVARISSARSEADRKEYESAQRSYEIFRALPIEGKRRLLTKYAHFPSTGGS